MKYRLSYMIIWERVHAHHSSYVLAANKSSYFTDFSSPICLSSSVAYAFSSSILSFICCSWLLMTELRQWRGSSKNQLWLYSRHSKHFGEVPQSNFPHHTNSPTFPRLFNDLSWTARHFQASRNSRKAITLTTATNRLLGSRRNGSERQSPRLVV